MHFSKAAGKQGTSDAELCQAVAELDQGKGDNLGGNVWKKRLKNNLAIDELRGFKKLAKDFANGGIAGIEVAKQNGSLKELCHDSQE